MPQVIAHRGASAVEQENTCAAFRRAAALGADAVELDVRRSADDVLVVHHNPDLADGRLIKDLQAADLPLYVPTFEQALDACAGMWVNVEIKNDPNEPGFDPTDRIADDTIAALAARYEDDRWLISSFRLETIDRCRVLTDSIPTAWLTVDVPDGVARMLADRGHAAWHPWFPVASAAVIGACHQAGIRVNTWTCDDPEIMARLLDDGIDGICTNVPDVARDVIARRR